ncbi:MAG TPA: Bax inhibitor-1/YccA family protein [bacterium]|nr:Bax inhibitor-1/YccA family protein [bacterium]
MRSGNPALGDNTFTTVAAFDAPSDVMTLQGAVNKSFILLFLVVLSAAMSWVFLPTLVPPEIMLPTIFGASIAGLITGIVVVFKKNVAPVLAPVYALLEGVVLGLLSFFMEMAYPGIVVQAVVLTFGIFFTLLLLYKSRIIPVTENFKLGIAAATGGIMILYLVNLGLRLFGAAGIGFIHESGALGIGFSVFVVIIASLNLVLDFDFIEKGAEMNAPKYMEWYAAFGLIVTLIWLYIEILRLLSKLRRR